MYTAKIQTGISLDTTFSAEVFDSYFFQVRGRYFGFTQSGGGSDWVSYRGFEGLSAGLGWGMLFPEVSLFKLIPATPSFAFRGYGNFSRYNYTEIYFFFLTFEVEPMLQILSFNNEQMALQIGVPLAWNYQRDIELFFTAGLSLKILFSLNGKEPRV